jgi:alpha-beta hydrolase superfamily lysophospholipase
MKPRCCAISPLASSGRIRQIRRKYDSDNLFYPQARHEIVNETNRDEAQHDILRWMESVLG